MEISNIEKPSSDITQLGGVRNTAAQPAPPSKESIREKAEPNRPAAARRPPPLMNAITQSLNQAGLETTTANAVQGTRAAEVTQSENDLETSQSEKVTQALQAFMHSLVQAMNTRSGVTENQTASLTSYPPTARALESQMPPSRAADAYSGLISRLEDLARKLEGTSASANGNSSLDQLSATFDNLAGAVAENGAVRQGTAPKLQDVLQNMIRNLQSTGDPTLASTGNVINTAA